jgi:hypothetical protein
MPGTLLVTDCCGDRYVPLPDKRTMMMMMLALATTLVI